MYSNSFKTEAVIIQKPVHWLLCKSMDWFQWTVLKGLNKLLRRSITILLFISFFIYIKSEKIQYFVWPPVKTSSFKMSENQRWFYQQKNFNIDLMQRPDVKKKFSENIWRLEKQDGGERCLKTRINVVCQ